MAPRGTKRSATSPPRGSARKKSTADPVGPKTKDVVKAIQSAEGLPASCKDMLVNMVGSSLTILASERHSYQNTAVQMVGETVASVQLQMQNAVAQSQATVDNSDREKATRDATLESATTSLASLEEKATAAKADVDDARTAVADAKAASASAEEAIKSNAAEITQTTEQKAKLETALKDVFEPLKTSKSTGREGRKALDSLEKVLTDVGLEAGLVEHVPETLRKDPEARRTFDALVIKHVDEQAAKFLAKAEGSLQKAGETTAGLADDKTSAEAACTAAAEKLKESSEAKDAAQAALKEGQDSLKAAQSAVSGFEREMANTAEALEDSKSALTAFTDGALSSFTLLRDMALLPPPEVQSEISDAAPEPVVAAATA